MVLKNNNPTLIVVIIRTLKTIVELSVELHQLYKIVD